MFMKASLLSPSKRVMYGKSPNLRTFNAMLMAAIIHTKMFPGPVFQKKDGICNSEVYLNFSDFLFTGFPPKNKTFPCCCQPKQNNQPKIFQPTINLWINHRKPPTVGLPKKFHKGKIEKPHRSYGYFTDPYKWGIKGV